MKKKTMIDFDGRFSRYLLEWPAEHQDIAKDAELMEEKAYELYDEWLDTPKEWLDRLSPCEYFEEIDSPDELLSMMIDYICEGCDMPEMLMDRIIDLREQTYPVLYGMLAAEPDDDLDAEQLDSVKAAAVGLIQEMDMPAPIERYVEMMRDLEEQGDYSAAVQRVLTSMAEMNPDERIERIIEAAIPTSTDVGRICLTELLIGINPMNETALSELKDMAADEGMEEHRADIADLMGMTFSEDFAKTLKEWMNDDAADYVTYTRARYAYESITGEEVPPREFDGDPVYDMMAHETEDDYE